MFSFCTGPQKLIQLIRGPINELVYIIYSIFKPTISCSILNQEVGRKDDSLSKGADSLLILFF